MADEQETPSQEKPSALTGSGAMERSSVIEKGMVVDAARVIEPVSQAPTEIPQPPTGAPVSSAVPPDD
jgi:hypothetical protein